MKIISGGQTGVDRAALDAAIAVGISHGGWCPKGRLAELNTTIPERYNMIETKSEDYSLRTKLNIRDSGATLIIVPNEPIKITGGTILTIEEVKRKNMPYLIVSLSERIHLEKIIEWITSNRIETLNVAGPRESQSPGIYKSSFNLLLEIFNHLTRD